MKFHRYNSDFNFVKAPIEFNKYTDRDTLQYCLGSTLYMPGTKDIRDKVEKPRAFDPRGRSCVDPRKRISFDP